MKRFFVNQRYIIVSILIFIVIAYLISGLLSVQASKLNGITIIVDAGHGGLDVK